MSGASPTRTLVHGRVELALHALRGVSEPTLLVLHELGGAGRSVPLVPEVWTGSVWALDFTGHGASTVPGGGGATPEHLLGDVDSALQELGPATLLGYGLGAYVALLAVGALPELVRGAVLAPGAGVAGGGEEPDELAAGGSVTRATLQGAELIRAELEADVRPPGYATLAVRQARHLCAVRNAVAVAPELVGAAPWVDAVASAEGCVVEPVGRALERLGAASAAAAG